MKYLFIILSIIFVSCTKSELRDPVNPEVCDFGSIQFSMTKRPFNMDIAARRAPKKDRGPKAPTEPVVEYTEATVILLDFDGHHVTGTNWNHSGDFTVAYSGLNETEQATILANMKRHYAPFNVIVTTDEEVYNRATKKVRVVFTETWEWYGRQVGGVAYTGSYKWDNDTPVFVFSSLLGYHVRNIYLAGSHEAGHAIGLKHQAHWDEFCKLISPYNYGGGGKAPIMGVAYNQPEEMWWVGPTSYGCNTIQDDAKVLTANTR